MNAPAVPFALPDITEREIEEVSNVLRGGWITTGARAKDFEQRFAERVGAPYAVAVNSCTAAMHLALEAIGVGLDDEVILPAMTFAATGEVVKYLGARPVLVDILESDHTIDPAAVERALSPRTRCIIPVHFAGKACRMKEILEIANRAKDCRVVEDAAHALPTMYQGQTVGSIGDVTCFSFYATKTLTTGEGGMATTANEDWATRMGIMSLHGISRDAWKRYARDGSWYYEIVEAGYKYNMTDIAAAIGLVQLERLDQMHQRRLAIAREYQRAFESDDAIDLLASGPDEHHAWHLFVIKLRNEALRLDRAEFVQVLKDRGIGASVHFIPLHLHPYYQSALGYRAGDAPVADSCYRRAVSLPIYSRMSDSDVGRVIDVIKGVVAEFRR